MLAVSAGVAVLRGGRNRRDRSDDRDRTVLVIVRCAALRVLPTALLFLPRADLLPTRILCIANGSIAANDAHRTRAADAPAATQSFPGEPCAAAGLGCILFLPCQQRLLPLCCELHRRMAVRPNHTPTTLGAAINHAATSRKRLSGQRTTQNPVNFFIPKAWNDVTNGYARLGC